MDLIEFPKNGCCLACGRKVGRGMRIKDQCRRQTFFYPCTFRAINSHEHHYYFVPTTRLSTENIFVIVKDYLVELEALTRSWLLIPEANKQTHSFQGRVEISRVNSEL